jgi:hypothetical protein
MSDQVSILGPCEERTIRLNNGAVLNVQLTPEIVRLMKEHFNLEPDQLLDDAHVRSFLYHAVDSAVSKVE